MGGGYLEEQEWERIFRQKRAIEKMMEAHTLAAVMATDELTRKPIHYPEIAGNRQQRRAAARKAK